MPGTREHAAIEDVGGHTVPVAAEFPVGSRPARPPGLPHRAAVRAAALPHEPATKAGERRGTRPRASPRRVLTGLGALVPRGRGS
jgi:hypothetical protein